MKIIFRGQDHPKRGKSNERNIKIGSYNSGSGEELDEFVIPEVGDITVYGKILRVDFQAGDPANAAEMTVYFEPSQAQIVNHIARQLCHACAITERDPDLLTLLGEYEDNLVGLNGLFAIAARRNATDGLPCATFNGWTLYEDGSLNWTTATKRLNIEALPDGRTLVTVNSPEGEVCMIVIDTDAVARVEWAVPDLILERRVTVLEDLGLGNMVEPLLALSGHDVVYEPGIIVQL